MTFTLPAPRSSLIPPGYKQTEVGVIPEEWKVEPVRQKGEVLTGKALAINAPGAQRPYLRTKNVFDGRIDIDDGPRGIQVINALYPLLSRDRTATKAMYEIIKNQPGY